MKSCPVQPFVVFQGLVALVAVILQAFKPCEKLHCMHNKGINITTPFCEIKNVITVTHLIL